MALILTSLIAATATDTLASEADPYSGIRSVAVISITGETLNFQTRGLTVLTDSEEEMPIPEWGIDKWMTASLTKALAARFQVKDANVDRAAVASCDFKRGCPDLAKPEGGVDAFIVVHKSEEPGPLRTTLMAKGIGVFFTSIITSKYNPTIHVDYVIDVVDAKTGKVLASGRNNTPALFMLTNDWPNKWQELSPQQQQIVKEIITDMIEKSLPTALANAKLPPPGGHIPRLLAPAYDPDVAAFVANTRTVAVLSVLGDRLYFVNPGNAFVTRTEANALAPSDWQVDAEAEKIVANSLAGRFVVKNIPLQSAALSQTVAKHSDPALPVDLPRSGSIDAYVLITKADVAEHLFPGIGLRHTTPVFNHETAVYADYAVAIVNARTLRQVAIYFVKIGEEAVPCLVARKFPSGLPECTVDESLWPKTPEPLTPDAAATIREKLSKILSTTLPESLLQLGLLP
ncbi:MAG: hypothetical protein JO261_03325 [Alphaproteobacteria bacterium]|nr:hypothetical protein [Alphaproteobacteria bacterium]MBV9692712.1 hypothetical protein [Alphaproteobacteria bacterium]